MKTKITPSKKIILSVIAAALIVVSCRETEIREKPKETITLERAHEMFMAYQERYDAVTKLREGKEDSRYGWHSIDFYKNYIAYLEHESNKVNIKVSGLRLYYVAYPDDEQSGNQGDYQTYIFVPTYFDETTRSHIAFDPLHVDENGKPLPLHDFITKGRFGNTKAMLVKNQAETESSIGNMGEMCKPNCSASE
jgi:hypothetical protein